MKKNLVIPGPWACVAVALSLAVTGCGAATTEHPPSECTDSESVKAAANDAFLALFRDYSEDGVRAHIAPDFVQHNPFVPTGRDALIGFLPGLRESGIEYTNHRILQDGEFVVLHNSFANAQAFGAENIVTFDIYRMDGCQATEHWDAIMPLTPPNPSGRTLPDGSTTVTDLDKTEANKAIARTIFDTIINGTPEEVGAVVTANFLPDYLQHSPTVGDGVPAVFAAFAAEGWDYDVNYIILGEGNFVLSVSEGTVMGVHSAFYDLLRFEDGKVAEHWDVIQTIPTENLANDNGMFGFE